jgi:beta-galactosidase beta subunit
MIVANLQEIGKQVALTDAMQKGLAFLRENQGKVLEDGRIVIDGDRVFALVQSTIQGDPEVMFEAIGAILT